MTPQELKARLDAYAARRSLALAPSMPVILQASGVDSVPTGSYATDAQQGLAFFVSQLAYTEAQVFARQYEPMQYQSLVPLTSEAGEWAEAIRYETQDMAAKGKRVSGAGDDIPYADVDNGERLMGVAPGGIGYQYNQQEIIASAYFKRPLSSSRMSAVVEGFNRHMNEVALFGEGSAFQGLFKHASIPKGNRPSGKNWLDAATTPKEILGDLNAGMLAVYNSSSKNDIPSHVVLPSDHYAKIATTPYSDASDKTILQYFLENNLRKATRGDNVTVMPGNGLETAGTGGTTRILFYVKSQDRLVMHIPMPLRFLAPQLVNLSVKVPGMYRYTGVEVRYTKSAYYMEGV